MGVHVLGVSLVGLALYLVGRLVWRRSTPLPPGWPLIVNLFDLLRIKHSEPRVVNMAMLGAQWLVLNSFIATKDLFEKKSAIISQVFWSAYRHQQSLVTFYPAEEAEARQFVLNVLKNPDDLIAHCRRSTASLILKISHDHSVNDNSDPLVKMADRAVRNLSEVTSPGHFLVDFLPILRYLPEWFPGGGFHKDAKRWRNIVSEAVNTPYEFVLEHLAKGDAAPSLTSRSLQEGVTPEDEEILKWTSFAIFLGGSDMVPSMLSAFFLSMTMYPEVLKKGQAEVDTVVGNDRLPTMEDRDALPYVHAICTELLRWNVLTPLPFHLSIQDIVYEGYSIPKGTWLLPNIWFILSDTETYPDPDVFDAGRFLGWDQRPDARETCFGWGRRRCPGAHPAELMFFIYVAMALATLDVSRCVENVVEWCRGLNSRRA